MNIYLVAFKSKENTPDFAAYLCASHATWTVTREIVLEPHGFKGVSINPQDKVKVCQKCEWDHELQKRS